MIECKNSLSLILSIWLDTISYYDTTIKGRFLLFFMKINFTPDQLLSLAFFELPPSDFPCIVLQLYKIVHFFDQVYVHFICPVS